MRRYARDGALAQGRWHQAMGFNPFTPARSALRMMLVVTWGCPAGKRFAAIHQLSRIEERMVATLAMILWGFWRMWMGLVVTPIIAPQRSSP